MDQSSNKQLRLSLRQKRRNLSAESQLQASKSLVASFFNNFPEENFQTFSFYMAADGEIDPSMLVEKLLSSNCQGYLPVMNPNDFSLTFRQYKNTDALIRNSFGLLEPDSFSPTIEAANLDVVFMPLVGFDSQCNRMGMGAGYYDRAFAFKKEKPDESPLLIGLAHECQRVEILKNAKWDVPLDVVMTDRQCYRINIPGKFS